VFISKRRSSVIGDDEPPALPPATPVTDPATTA
jgi:hypothetical protein